MESIPEEQEQLQTQREKLIVEYFQPFYYDSSNQQFVVGVDEEKVDLDSLGDRPFSLVDITEDTADVVKLEAPLLLNGFGNLVVRPKLKSFLIEISRDPEKREKLETDTRKVMIDTYKRFRPTDQIVDSEAIDHMSFRAQVSSDGRFILTTLGNCACLGPEGSRLDIFNMYDEYTFHNIDTPFQAVSLYAGAGYLAKVAKELL
ncbi:MAG: hypothetical protein WDZ42_01405 [Candidatus Saccharimonadales bacterium]